MKLVTQRCLMAVAILALVVSWQGHASAASVKWNQDLKKAAVLSQKTGKPILITFTASWCTYCHKLIGETFTDQQLAGQVNECFVPVVLDADANERAVSLLGVEVFPTTLIISPKLDVIGRVTGFHRAPQMAHHLKPFCPSRPENLKQAVVASIPMRPAAQPVVAKKTAPVTAFSGMCLVSMLDDRKLVAGSPEITEEIKGVKLHFASEEHLDTFRKSATKYWPAADGHCPVASVRGEKETGGDASTAAVYRGQVILFRSMKHREEFAKAPRDFMNQLEALQHASR